MSTAPTLYRKLSFNPQTDFEYVGKFKEMLTLEAIKADSVLCEMMVCQRGTRLSITPVDPLHFKRACKLAGFNA